MSLISNIKKIGGDIGTVVKKTYGPLAALDTDLNYTTTSFRYPLDVGDIKLFPHTVEFQCWRPKPTLFDDETKALDKHINDVIRQDQKSGKQLESLRPRVATFGNDVSAVPLNAAALNEKGPRINRLQDLNPRIADWKRRVEVAELIALYLPPGAWNDSVSNQYRTESLTKSMGWAGLLLEAGGSVANAQKDDQSIITAAANLLTEVGVKWGAKVLGADPEVMADVGIQARGYAVNPQFEVLYDSTEMRFFQFDFVMTPRNRKEADEVLNIIRTFKFHASPEYTTGAGRFIIPPSIFDITFKYRGEENNQLPLISTCVLEKFDCNYSGGLDQWTSFEDGMPLQVQMVLYFKELELMHKRLRQEGY